MNSLLRIFSIIALVVLPSMGSANPVQQLNQSEILSIQEYVIKSSSNVDGKLLRTISLVVKNKTNTPLHHVYLYLDGMPSHVTGEGWAYFQELSADVSQESTTTVDYAVDLSRQKSSELELIWQIKTEINGEQVIDEISVKEILQ